MAIVVIVLMILCCTAKAVEASPRNHHQKFHKAEESDQFKIEACNGHHNRLRNEVIEKSKCGAPKEVFVELKLQVSYLQVTPSAVWAKRCVGLCDYHVEGSKCMATKKKTEHVPVRIYNLKTNKEMCATYALEVHESCGCCAMSSEDCAAPRVYNPPEPGYEVESL